MSQHDYDIANAAGSVVRADINSLVAAIASQNSGASAPSVTFPNMWWYDTTNSLLKLRNPANSAWMTFASITGSTIVIDQALLKAAINTDWFGTTVRFPRIDTSGIMDIGGRLDMHGDAAHNGDYQARLLRATGTNGKLTLENTGSGSLDIVPGSGGLTINSVAFDTMPIGIYVPYGGTAAPAKWLLAQGQNVNRATYSALFAVYGIIYGAGNGTTTFTLPDLRGRVVAGKDNMGGTSANRLTASVSGGIDGDVLGGVGGNEDHVLTIGQLATHDHTGSVSVAADGSHNHTQSGGDDDGNPNGGRFAITGTVHFANMITSTAPDHSHAGSTISVFNRGSSGAHNNVQPTIIANYIIYAGA